MYFFEHELVLYLGTSETLLISDLKDVALVSGTSNIGIALEGEFPFSLDRDL